jgi:hypothetical protein
MYRDASPSFDDDTTSVLVAALHYNNDNAVDDDRHNTLSNFLTEPMKYDVLCGRDRNYMKHPGNVIYRQLVEQHIHTYACDLPKQEKMNITRLILSTMERRYGSRFIRQISSTGVGRWEILSHAQARDKISHALRNFYKQQTKKNLATTTTTTDTGGNKNDINANVNVYSCMRGDDHEISANIAIPHIDMGQHQQQLQYDAILHDIGHELGSFDDDSEVMLDDSTTSYIDLFGRTPSPKARTSSLRSSSKKQGTSNHRGSDVKLPALKNPTPKR